MEKKNGRAMKSYVHMATDEEPQRLALFWHKCLGIYTLLGSRVRSVVENVPLSAEEHKSRCDYDFEGEAQRTLARYGYGGKLVPRCYNMKIADELKDPQNVGIDQFAFLMFFDTEKPVPVEKIDTIFESYMLTHPNMPSPVLRTQAEIAEAEDVYHRLVKDAREGVLFTKE